MPWQTSARRFSRPPLAMTTEVPERTAMSAASSLVYMPPVPMPEWLPPASSNTEGSRRSTRSMRWAVGSRLGSAV